MSPALPQGFVAIESGAATAWARPEARAWVENALDQHGSIYEAGGTVARGGAGGGAEAEAGALGASQGPTGPLLHGRAPIRLVPGAAARGDSGAAADGTSRDLAKASPTWAIRHYHRGGWMTPFLGDRYLRVGAPRPFRETIASELLRARGVPTPRVVAAAAYRSGPVYRADLVTELVPDTVDLGRFLFGGAGAGAASAGGGSIGAMDPHRLDTLAEVGRLVRAIADAGARHADLNVKNLLVGLETTHPTLHVVDLDRCEIGVSPPEDAVSRMKSRLLQSIAAWEKRTGTTLRPEEHEALIRGMRSQSHAR